MKETRDLLLRKVSVPESFLVGDAHGTNMLDLHISGGRIHSWGKDIALPDAEETDCAGMLILPGLVDSHVHLDKTIWGSEWLPSRLPAVPTLADLVGNESAMRTETRHDPRVYAPRLLEEMMKKGTTALRSHIDVDPTTRLDGVATILEVRENFREKMDIELVAFPQSGILRAPGVIDLLDEALKMGVDAVGGLDPAAFDKDPVEHLDIVFRLAARHGVKIDIHLHEPGALGAFSIRLIADRVKEYGLRGKVTLSHAFALGQLPEGQFDEFLELLAENRISVVTNVPGGTEFAPHIPLLGKGINYALGSDNIRDYWSPLGNGDMLDRVRLLALRRKLRHESSVEQAARMATFEGARLMGLDDYGLAPGCRADCVLVKAACLTEAVALCPLERKVVKNGRFMN